MFILFYAKNVYVYWFTIKCFKLIKNDNKIKTKFLYNRKGVKIENPKISVLGILYFYVIIPPDIPAKFIEDFLNSQFVVVNDMLMAMDLAGVIKVDKREFITEIEDDNNYIDSKIYKYIMKFRPIFWFSRPRKFLFFILTFLISWFLFRKYHIFEYITMENVNMILGAIKNFLST